ncbi:hypothetical protein OsJ_08692 [Oryza sativa Japonica Group]|uniref:Pentatricopeptide repeat-containing protein n=1 Tax=Oryza sativa subsp. japonica TaxID=39947 RepID=B9F3Z3_ORYSJ|nr:hypothetical protein OsJ_08692 [Oryza sativa Japonica Group]
MARGRGRWLLPTRLLNVCLAALCRGGSLAAAESVLVDAIRLGLPPDVVTYNTLLAAHCRAAGLEAGLVVMGRMREAGVEPDAVTYNSLIAGAARRGLPIHALDLFDEMLPFGDRPRLLELQPPHALPVPSVKPKRNKIKHHGKLQTSPLVGERYRLSMCTKPPLTGVCLALDFVGKIDWV